MLWRLVSFCLLLTWAGFGPGAALAQPATESSVKAAFLYKFGGYVEWPATAFQRPSDPLVIGVLGDDEVARDLEQLSAGRTVDAHPVAVRRVAEGSSVAGSHILYIGSRAGSRLREAIDAVQGPVLVVTSQAGALQQGSVINFSNEAGRVRFSASLAAAEARGLRLSARLLAVALAVEGRAR